MALKYRVFCNAGGLGNWEECAQVEDTALGLAVDAITNDISMVALLQNGIGTVVEIRQPNGTTVVSRFSKMANF